MRNKRNEALLPPHPMTILSFTSTSSSSHPPQAQPTHCPKPIHPHKPASKLTYRPSRPIRNSTKPITHHIHSYQNHVSTHPPTSYLATLWCKSRTYPYLYLTYSNEGTAHTTKGPT
jgi:hypothetical protein